MKRIIKIALISIIISIILFILLFSSGTFSKFAAKITGNSTAEVAEPVFVLNGGEKKSLNDENTEIEYTFDICNFNQDGKRTETELKYQIEIEPESIDNSISFELYNSTGDKIDLNGQKTDYITIKHNKDITQSYRLIVKYDRTKTDSTTDIQENIYIKAVAVQS